MKIDNISHLTTPNRVDQGQESGKAGTSTERSTPDSGSVTHLSQAGSDPRQDVNQARVAELRQAIAEGRLTINADRIADRLIDSARDLAGGPR